MKTFKIILTSMLLLSLAQTSCSKRRHSNLSAVISDLKAPALASDNTVTIIAASERNAETGKNQTEWYIKSGDKNYQIACKNKDGTTSDEVLVDQVIAGIGLSRHWYKFLVPQEKPKSFQTFDCKSKPDTQGLYYVVEKNIRYDYVIDASDEENMKAYLLGCTGLQQLFGISGQPQDDGDGYLLSSVPKGNIHTINCSNGKKFGPELSNFALATESKKNLQIFAGETTTIPIEFEVEPQSDSLLIDVRREGNLPCSENAIWWTLSGPGNRHLIIGSRPLIEDHTCNLKLVAEIGEEEFIMPLAISIKPRVFEASSQADQTKCVGANTGAVECFGKYRLTIPTPGADTLQKADGTPLATPFKSIVNGTGYVCALYANDEGDNLRCAFSDETAGFIGTRSYTKRATSLAGTPEFVCFAEFKTATSSQLNCQQTNPSLPATRVPLPDARSLINNTALAADYSGAICYDTDVSGKKQVICTNHEAYSNLPLATGTDRSNNIRNLNQDGGISGVAGLTLNVDSGCAEIGNRAVCWGKPGIQPDSMSTQAINPGSLHLTDRGICFESTLGEITKLQCTDFQWAPRATSVKDFKAADGYRGYSVNAQMNICRVFKDRTECDDNTSWTKNRLNMEGPYWTKKITTK